MSPYNVGLLIVSDTAFQDNSQDRSTSKIEEFFNNLEQNPGYKIIKKDIVPDSIEQIQLKLKQWTENDDLKLILTSGGTGFSDKDITPEAVKPLLEKEASGIIHTMLSYSLKITPFAMMSRPVAGIKNKSLIITIPGSPKGAVENIEGIIGVLGHALKQIGNDSSRSLHKVENPEITKIPDTPKTESHSHGHGHHHHHHGHSGHSGHGVKRHIISNDLNKPITQRARSSPYPMIEVSEALELINKHTPKSEIIIKQINDPSITGYILAEDIYADINVPNFEASIVDGYAVINTDGPGIYKVVQVSHASPSLPNFLKPGEIARVTTGAPIPQGANAVIMVEETELVSTKNNGEEEDEIKILAKGVEVGDNVRKSGSDISKGELVLRKGTIISPVGGEIGVLASIGKTSVKVYQKPIIGVLSTGDELVDLSANCPNFQLKHGQIFDTNRPLLLQTLQNWGFEVVDLGIANDSSQATEDKLHKAFKNLNVDYIVTTGGVSMGELDLLKPTIEQKLGGIIHFGRVAMKPGKPTTFATIDKPEIYNGKRKIMFALPGNPASASVTAHLFLLPSLRKFSGYINIKSSESLPTLSEIDVYLTKDTKLDPRPEYQRAFIHQQGDRLVADTTGFQRSSRVGSIAGANALLVLPSSKEVSSGVLTKGTKVKAIIITTL
ncbi:putative gephyrin [Wickerhamomyces ciferrii]|uniref:Gephyrin n=1 Tax=Wickerhamomyces ciferrii (strain ATCC 14091 / BCRC 22168 / CBS 111 / JCM 3599 / NBRC 0793 / NRRL Y-1031 F-60-10) TaxID=1206466 RepID=K0KGH9_WICCF|nr:putative gephyrin [Wickerhamomyces ciferrii]CCH41277.1 putative gephyrin [Wickerhamomyces ciferrii]